VSLSPRPTPQPRRERLQATPSSDGAFFYFLTDEIGIGPEFLGRIKVGTSLASLLGIWLYRNFLQEVPIKKTLSSLSVVSAVLGLSQLLLITHANRDLGIDDKWFTFGDDLILTVLGQLAFMPLLVLAASLCPPGVEGTLFALLMSIFNGGGIVGMELGALLTSALGVSSASEGGPTDFTNLGLLVIICNLSSLLPLLAIGWLDEVEATHADGSSADGPGAAATAAATPAVAVGDALVAGQSGQPGALASAASAVEPSPANLGEAPAAVASDANASRDRHA